MGDREDLDDQDGARYREEAPVPGPPRWAFPEWPILGVTEGWTARRWLAGFNASVGEPVWAVTLSHGDWHRGPRLTTITQHLPSIRRRTGSAPREARTAGAAALLSHDTPGPALRARAEAVFSHVEDESRWRRTTLAVDGAPRGFSITTLPGAEIAVSDPFGDLVLLLVALETDLASYRYGVIDPEQYGLSPGRPLPQGPGSS